MKRALGTWSVAMIFCWSWSAYGSDDSEPGPQEPATADADKVAQPSTDGQEESAESARGDTADDQATPEQPSQEDENPPAPAAEEASSDASAPVDEAESCLASHEKAQVQRMAGDLQAAENELKQCAREVCPEALRDDCVTWRAEVLASFPSLVVRVLSDDGDVEDATVFIDGEQIKTKLDGRPVRVNPGNRVIRVVLPSGKSKELKVLLSQGEKSRLVTADFRTQQTAEPNVAASPAAPPRVATRPVPVVTYVLAGVAAGAGVTATAVGIHALSLRKEANDACAPHCDESVSDRVSRAALITDVAIGVGIASALTATAFYLYRPTVYVEENPAAGLDWQLSASPLGGQLSVGGRF